MYQLTMPEHPSPGQDRELLLYIAAKVARITAITDSIHSMLFKDLEPADEAKMKQRQWAIQMMYNSNIAAERSHFKTQFPDDYKALDEYITLEEQETTETSLQAARDILEGKIDVPDVFREPPPKDEGTPPGKLDGG